MLLPAAAVSGLLLAAAHRWPRATGLLLVALLPVLAAIVVERPGPGLGALAGAVVGAGYSLPMVLHLRFPFGLASGLAIYLALGFTLVGAGAAWCLRLPHPLLVALATAGVLVLGDRLTVLAVPAWGTAQSWIRPLSRWPQAAALARWAGQPLVLLAVVLPQCLLAATLADGGVLAIILPAAAVLAAALAGMVAGRRRPGRTLRVAALGWDFQQLISSGLAGQAVDEAALIVAPIARAAAAGARLLVTPETGLLFSRAQRERWVVRLSALSAEHGITLVVGFMDETSGENRAGIFTPTGGLVAEYAKTHLVIAAGEHRTCRAGRGDTIQVEVDGVRVGVLICHDDNFTGPARRHARAGTQLLAVPTNDWAEVRHAHLENVPWRAIENGLAIVRGATGGFSAVIAPDGRIVEHLDHTRDGLGLVVADVAVEADHGR